MAVEGLLHLHIQLNALARSWLYTGADSFEIWSEGQLVERWSAATQANHAYITAPIMVDDRIVAALRVNGLSDWASQERLAVEAQMLERLLHSEHELSDVTAHLIGIQDQLLRLSHLVRVARRSTAIEPLLNTVAEQIRLLLPGMQIALLLTIDEQTYRYGMPYALSDELYSALQTQAAELEDALLLNYPLETCPLPGGVRTLVLSPVWVQHAVCGFLAILNKKSEFDSLDLRLASTVTEHLGVQLERLLLAGQQPG